MNRKFILKMGNRKKFRDYSDELLAQKFTSGSQNEILDELFDRYVHLVYGLCMKYFRDDEKARDTTMIIFESLPQKLEKFEVKSFKAWLYTVARNTCLMELRKKKKEIHVEYEKIIHLQRVEIDDTDHLNEEENEKVENMTFYLNKLNQNQQVCLNLLYFENMSYKEIAEKTGFSMKEVKSNIQNGKRKLKNYFKPNNEE